MKISVNWLKEFTSIDLPVDELVKKIGAQLGAVEEVIDLGQKYSAIKIVKVEDCAKHPNADKLNVCQIDTGKEKVQVVCGAPNVRAGMLAAWIPPGNTVPSTFDKDPFVLEAREIRGEVSNGMLASASELAVGDDHSGIVELEQGKPGDDFAKIYGLDDYIIDIENKMFTHRPDCFGILGVAREIAGIQHRAFKSPEWYLNKAESGKRKAESGELPLEVHNEIPELVPRFMAVSMSNVTVAPSPLWLQIRLSSIGLKPINNIVDLTNYYMYLTGQPLHAYDYDKVAAKSSKEAVLSARFPKKGETLKLLNGKTIEPHDKAILIATDKEAIGIGGVMGGADTEVDANTKSIILECANFDLYSVRKTSMTHGLFTDAVTRFSKGQSSLQIPAAINKVIEDVEKIAGAKQASEVIDSNAKLPTQPVVNIAAEFINQRLGTDLNSDKIANLLNNVEFEVEIKDASLVVKAPFWRTDIELPEDIVEEVGRLYGYDHLPLQLPKRTSAPAQVSSLLALKKELAQELAAAGANEVLTYSFVHERLFEAAGQDKSEAYKINNALSPDLQYYRLSITPSILDKVHPNIKAGFDTFALFELGKVHGKSEIDKEGLPKEFERLALVFADKKKSGGAAYYQAQKLLATVLQKRFDNIRLMPLSQSKIKGHKLFDQLLAPYDPARSAIIYFGPEWFMGVIGEYKQSVSKTLKLPAQTAGFEIFLKPLTSDRPANYSQLSRFPDIAQDITLQTSANTKFADLQAALDSALSNQEIKDLVISTECIDIYADSKNKNTTFRITAFSYDRTLTTDLMNNLLDQVVAETQKSIAAKRI